MRLKKSVLKKIILEELELFYEVNPAHKGKGPGGGQFAKKGKGKTYSLTKNAEDDVAPDSELEVPARGNITAKGKVSSKFGMNTGDEDKQCGRCLLMEPTRRRPDVVRTIQVTIGPKTMTC